MEGAGGPHGARPLQLELAVLSRPAPSAPCRHNIIAAHGRPFRPINHSAVGSSTGPWGIAIGNGIKNAKATRSLERRENKLPSHSKPRVEGRKPRTEIGVRSVGRPFQHAANNVLSRSCSIREEQDTR